MDLNSFLTFLVAALTLTLLPGPDNMYVITESLSRGFKRGFSLSLGLASGVLVHTILTASGLAILIREWPALSWFIRLTGAAYLLYLAYQAWKEKPQSFQWRNSQNSSPKAFWTSYKKGFLMNVLNPKVTLFFLALLPQFISADSAWSSFYQMLLMGVTFMLQAALIFSLMAALASYFGSFLQRPAFWAWSRILQIVILGIIALSILFV
ncbi:MAG: threonine/homoserine/homoserine lactone efflux protein [Roseivirga sp.]|jgi:threonine/homoserine/homoserine lactone efflux protein